MCNNPIPATDDLTLRFTLGVSPDLLAGILAGIASGLIESTPDVAHNLVNDALDRMTPNDLEATRWFAANLAESAELQMIHGDAPDAAPGEN